MKRYIFLLAAGIVTGTFANAQYSDAYWPYKGAADGAGEIITVFFNNDTVKMWRVADGELVFNDKEGAFGFSSRMLRYKVQAKSWKSRNTREEQTTVRSYDGNTQSVRIKEGGDWFAGFNVDLVPGALNTTYMDVDNKITLFSEISDGKASLYSVLHVNDPKFNGLKTKHYSNMTKILSRKGLEKKYIFEPLTSPSGKYAFLTDYGVMISVEKNKELWDITKQLSNGEYDGYDVVFSSDETQVAIADFADAPDVVRIYDVKKGKVLQEFSVADALKQKLENYSMYMSSDMKSYIVDGKVKGKAQRETWLVKADGSMKQLM